MPFAAVPEETPKITESLSPKSLLARGSAWAVFGQVASQVLRLGGNLILWRLLFPEAFGMMAIVNVFMTGLAMFTDVGIGQSIVQHERGDDPAYLNTVWTIQIVRGTVIGLVACVAAIPIARFYNALELAYLLPIVAVSSIIAGFESTKLFSATRHVVLGRRTIVELTCQAAGLIVMVIWAAVSRSVWALAVGAVASSIVRVVLSHKALPGVSNRLQWEKAAAKDLARFGRWVFLSTLLTFFAMQSDRLVFGKLVSLEQLGVYSIAMTWASVPNLLIGHIFFSVVFPVLSRLRMQNVPIATAFASIRWPMLTFTAWLTACIVSGGPTLIRFLYGARAVEAGWIIQVLALGAWFAMLEMSIGIAFLAQGKPQWSAAANAAKLIAMITLIPAGFRLLGFPGAVIGYAAADLAKYFVSRIAATGAKFGGVGGEFGLTLAIAATSAVGIGARKLAANVAIPTLLEGIAVFIVVTALWGAVYGMQRVRARSALASTA